MRFFSALYRTPIPMWALHVPHHMLTIGKIAHRIELPDNQVASYNDATYKVVQTAQ